MVTLEAALEHRPKWCSRRSSTDAQLEVRERAHRERDPFATSAFDERGILVAADAVIDALGRAGGRAPRGCSRAGLPRRRGRRCAGRASRALANTRANLLGGLPRSQESRPTPTIRVAVRQRLLERLDRVVLAEVAQEAQDQLGRDAERAFGVVHAVAHAADDDLHRDAAIGVRLRIEEQLGVATFSACALRSTPRSA